MSELVNIGDDNKALNMLIFEAMVLASGRGDGFEKRWGEGGPTVDIEVRVNGQVVPFMKAFEEAWKRIEARYDRDVHEAAVALIQGTRLSELLSTLTNAEYEIRQALNASPLNTNVDVKEI